MLRCFASTAVTAVFFLFVSMKSNAAIVWNGPLITFEKPAFANWTLPDFQDQITPQVAITRASIQGIFNIEVESSFIHQQSPTGTEWSYGTTANFANLTYTNWERWTAGNPPSTVGRNAVLHLIAEDIYIDIKFTSWGASAGGGGAFSYQRSTIPEPGSLALLGVGAFLLTSRRRR